jgi:hypothetical protein
VIAWLTISYTRKLFASAGVLLGLALACTALYSMQGAEREVAAQAPLEELGRWDYGGPLGVGVYDDDHLTSPQPFFRRLGEALPLRYDYAMSVNDASVITESTRGTYSLVAQVRGPSGWARTFPLTAQGRFDSARFAAATEVDLRRVADLVSALESATDYRSPLYRLRLIAHVDLEARVAGQPVARSFDHAIDFTVTDVEVRLDDPTALQRSEQGFVTYESRVPRQFTAPFTGIAVRYAALPVIATWAVGFAALLLALALGVSWRNRDRLPVGGPSPINSKWLIDVGVASIPSAEAAHAVLLTSLSALLRLAEHYQTPVLRVREGPVPTYWLLTDVVYAHRPAGRDAYEGAREAA